MAFNTKIQLDDRKVEQVTGTTLNLSGTTVIDGSNGVIKYSSQPTLTDPNALVTVEFAESLTTSGTTASTTYAGESPAAIEVGGVTIGTVLTGKTSNEILEEMLVPVLFPTLSNPSNGFSDDASNTQEVGVTAATINFTATFDRGSISPAYGTSGFRSGLPNQYNYTGTGLPATQASTSLTDNQSINDYVILAGANTWSSTVSYDAGEQPLDSKGGNFGSPLPAGTTSSQSVTVTGIYPWFYGTDSGGSRPTAGSALLVGSTKTVATSNGTVNANFNTSGAEWTWMATPATSTTKTVWYVTALNNGTIGGSFPSGNKYPAPTSTSVDSPTGLWSSISYKFYISEAKSVETNIEFRNS